MIVDIENTDPDPTILPASVVFSRLYMVERSVEYWASLFIHKNGWNEGRQLHKI